jgi:hypothetical protein
MCIEIQNCSEFPNYQQCSAMLLRFPHIPVSHLRQRVIYLDWEFLWFSSAYEDNFLSSSLSYYHTTLITKHNL